MNTIGKLFTTHKLKEPGLIKLDLNAEEKP
jgi:hypothetical protein